MDREGLCGHNTHKQMFRRISKTNTDSWPQECKFTATILAELLKADNKYQVLEETWITRILDHCYGRMACNHLGKHWSLKIEYLCTPLAKNLTPECPREESFLVWSGDRQQAVLTIARCPVPGGRRAAGGLIHTWHTRGEVIQGVSNGGTHCGPILEIRCWLKSMPFSRA